MLAEAEPVLHTKLAAPLAVSVVDAPAQMMEGDAFTEIDGDA